MIKIGIRKIETILASIGKSGSDFKYTFSVMLKL